MTIAELAAALGTTRYKALKYFKPVICGETTSAPKK